MVRTWIGDVRPLMEKECYERYWQRLPDFRKEKAGRCRFMEGRAQSAGAWALWQHARESCGLPQNAPFNLSHSGHYALCSVQVQGEGAQVGCDVQKIGPYGEGVAKRFFCPEEYGHIQAQESEEGRRKLFFRYWTLKESFIKATGKGMAIDLGSFCFSMKDREQPALEKCPHPYRKEDYYFMEFGLESYRGAVCSTDPEIDPGIQWVRF